VCVSSNRAVGPLLTVKHRVPVPRADLLRRARLEAHLDRDVPVTVVAAPAGWGKTSLLSRWAASSPATAWVSLDAADDEPTRFWSYAIAALAEVAPIAQEPGAALAAGGDGPTALALPLLLNELARWETPGILVLDDYQVITHPEIHESLEFFLAHLPSTLRVVIASRVDPPLPLARMRARGELGEVRADDLRFSAPEATAFLSTSAAGTVDDAVSAKILEQTEGWAAGLRLAVSATDGVRAPDERHLFDYLSAEVVPSFTPDQRELLIRAAPLELLSGPLCDAALGIDDSAALLDQLERAGLFIVALDRERHWYRCHHLLRNALGWTAEGEPSPPSVEVLTRAARWFVERGRIDDAALCLLSAHEYDAAAALLTEQWSWFVQQGWASTLLDVGGRLPEDAVNAGLALTLSYAATTCGHEDTIPHWLDLARRHAGDGSLVPGWRSTRAAELCMRGLFATDLAKPEAAVALLEECVALESAAGSVDHPTAMIGLADAYGFAGRFDEAADILERFWDDREQLLTTSIALQTAGQLALFLYASGDLDRLDRVLGTTVGAADAVEDEWGVAAAGPLVVLTRIVQARRSYERGDLAAAEAQLARGMWLAELTANAVWHVVALVFLADSRVAAGDRAAAREAVVRAREIADNEPVLPWIMAWLETAENRIGRHAAKAATRDGGLYEELTDRELSILRLLPTDATQREIGASLFLSLNTVKGYNKSLYRKLGVAGRADAVAVARRLGLI
jgi:LuxR family transcriptional regulator, maltose regulon positive regulatory protein